MLVYISSHGAAKRASQRKGKPAKDLLELEEEMLVQDPDIHLEEEALAEAEEPWVADEDQGPIDLEQFD
jgi:hypothetical protein